MLWLLLAKRKPHHWGFLVGIQFSATSFSHLHTISPFYLLRLYLLRPQSLNPIIRVRFYYIHRLPAMHGSLSRCLFLFAALAQETTHLTLQFFHLANHHLKLFFDPAAHLLRRTRYRTCDHNSFYPGIGVLTSQNNDNWVALGNIWRKRPGWD